MRQVVNITQKLQINHILYKITFFKFPDMLSGNYLTTFPFCNNNFYYHSEHWTQCYGAQILVNYIIKSKNAENIYYKT